MNMMLKHSVVKIPAKLFAALYTFFHEVGLNLQKPNTSALWATKRMHESLHKFTG
jgi:transposase